MLFGKAAEPLVPALLQKQSVKFGFIIHNVFSQTPGNEVASLPGVSLFYNRKTGALDGGVCLWEMIIRRFSFFFVFHPEWDSAFYLSNPQKAEDKQNQQKDSHNNESEG